MKNKDYAKHMKEIAEMTVEMMVEVMPEEKREVFRRACYRNDSLTTWCGLGFSVLHIYKEGYYLKMEGTRSSFAVYCKDDDGELTVTRKPKDSKLSHLWNYGWYNEMPKACEGLLEG